MKLLLVLVLSLVTIGHSQYKTPLPQPIQKRFCGGTLYWQNNLQRAIHDMEKQGCEKIVLEKHEFGYYMVWGESTVPIE